MTNNPLATLIEAIDATDPTTTSKPWVIAEPGNSIDPWYCTKCGLTFKKYHAPCPKCGEKNNPIVLNPTCISPTPLTSAPLDMANGYVKGELVDNSKVWNTISVQPYIVWTDGTSHVDSLLCNCSNCEAGFLFVWSDIQKAKAQGKIKVDGTISNSQGWNFYVVPKTTNKVMTETPYGTIEGTLENFKFVGAGTQYWDGIVDAKKAYLYNTYLDIDGKTWIKLKVAPSVTVKLLTKSIVSLKGPIWTDGTQHDSSVLQCSCTNCKNGIIWGSSTVKKAFDSGKLPGYSYHKIGEYWFYVKDGVGVKGWDFGAGYGKPFASTSTTKSTGPTATKVSVETPIAPLVKSIPKTQKARGCLALAKKQYKATTLRATSIITDISKVSDDVYVPSGTYFIRPCPSTPRPGFVNSRKASGSSVAPTIANVVKEMIAAGEPKGEILLSPVIEAIASGVIVAEKISCGSGNDGVTDGKDPISLEFSSPIDDLIASYVGNGIKHPHLEIVESSTGVEVVQAREDVSTPTKFEQGVRCKVVKVERMDASLDLLVVESRCKQLAEFVVDKGDYIETPIVHHPGGETTTHIYLQARIAGLPCIFDQEPPDVGSMIEYKKHVNADINAVRDGIVSGLASVVNNGSSAGAGNKRGVEAEVRTGIALLHLFSHLDTSHEFTAFALGFIWMRTMRILFALPMGEWRHNTASGETRKLGRETVYHGAWKLFVHDVMPGYLIAMAGMKVAEWGGAFGGPKWRDCCNALLRCVKGLHAVAHNPSKETYDELVAAMNYMVHCAHNGGWWINKLLPSNFMGEVAKRPFFEVHPSTVLKARTARDSAPYSKTILPDLAEKFDQAVKDVDLRLLHVEAELKVNIKKKGLNVADEDSWVKPNATETVSVGSSPKRGTMILPETTTKKWVCGSCSSSAHVVKYDTYYECNNCKLKWTVDGTKYKPPKPTTEPETNVSCTICKKSIPLVEKFTCEFCAESTNLAFCSDECHDKLGQKKARKSKLSIKEIMEGEPWKCSCGWNVASGSPYCTKVGCGKPAPWNTSTTLPKAVKDVLTFTYKSAKPVKSKIVKKPGVPMVKVCGHCSHSNPVKATICYGCKTPFTHGKTCPKCGHLNSPFGKKCVKCKKWIVNVESKDVVVAGVKPKWTVDGSWVCSSCTWTNDDDDTLCGGCGKAKPTVDVWPKWVCPSCHWSNNNDYVLCGDCGKSRPTVAAVATGTLFPNPNCPTGSSDASSYYEYYSCVNCKKPLKGKCYSDYGYGTTFCSKACDEEDKDNYKPNLQGGK